MDGLEEKIKKLGGRKRVFAFYTLNDDLKEEVVRSQLREMAQVGTGGVFVHARSGLTEEYLGERWFSFVDVIADECEKRGMELWIYDEFGWPSGIAGGLVIENEDFRVGWLEYEKGDGEEGVLSVRRGNGYVDVFNAKATETFLRCTHERYRKRYGNRIKGFFTDEPQFGLHHVPYSPVLAEEFRKETGEDILQVGAALFGKGEKCEQIKEKYYALAGRLFLENYTQKISAWCREYGYSFTGHYLEERAVSLQVESAGNLLRIYREMQMPGMDWLGKKADAVDAAPRQIASVCRQFGIGASISESYACAGYGAKADELKNVADWEFSKGINHICMVFPYSFRGRRKRDYPSGLMPGNPMFAKAKDYFSYLDCLGGLVAEGEERADVLVMIPYREAARVMGIGEKTNEIDGLYSDTLRALGSARINYHLSDDGIADDYGAVEGDRLRIGKRIYDRVLYFGEELRGKLKEYSEGGGKLYFVRKDNLKETVSDLEEKSFLRCDNPDVDVSEYFLGETPFYIVRNTRCTEQRFSLSGKSGVFSEWLPERKKICPPFAASEEQTLRPLETRIFALTDQREAEETKTEYLVPDPRGWKLLSEDKNVFPMDRCVPEIDGETFPETSVIGLNGIMLHKRGALLKMVFTAESEISGRAELAVENGDRFGITFNGKTLEKKKGKYFRDTFDLYPVELQRGKNVVELSCRYDVSSELVGALDGMQEDESTFNRVADTFDLENVLLLGDFSVRSDFSDCGNGCVFSRGNFVLSEREASDPSCLPLSGRPFFAGEAEFENTFFLNKRKEVRYLVMPELSGLAAEIWINGLHAADCFWNGRPYDVTDFVSDGKNTVRLKIVTDLRNLFGPFHNSRGNPKLVGFSTFSAEPGWCDDGNFWTDDYYVSKTGITFSDGTRKRNGENPS